MDSCFQSAALVASPSYPNSIAWSQENLIAVASGHLVTILNPASPSGPRGLITIPKSEAYPIGTVKREDLMRNDMLPISLNQDLPCIRSVAWSHVGMTPNSGCLLAICTTEGHVKLYRHPFSDFRAEWIEVMDVTDKLYNYLCGISFGESNNLALCFPKEQAMKHYCADAEPIATFIKVVKQRRVNRSCSINTRSKKSGEQFFSYENCKDVDTCFNTSNKRSWQIVPVVSETEAEKLDKRRKVADKIPENGNQITTDQYISRSAMLSSLVVAWSPVLRISSMICTASQSGLSGGFSILAIGSKSGKVSLWRVHAPECYYIGHNSASTTVMLIGILQAHNSWVTTMSLELIALDTSTPRVLLATGSSDGSVRIWLGDGEELLKSSELDDPPFSILKEVVPSDTIPVSVLSLIVTIPSEERIHLAIGKGSGSFEVWTCNIYKREFNNAGTYDAHDQAVTGLAWAFGGCCLYSCSQDNFVRSWILRENSLSEVTIPSNTPGLINQTDIPDAFLSCHGVAISPGNLALAMVRSFNVDLLNKMYQARVHKAALEFIWIGAQECDDLSKTLQKMNVKSFPGFSQKELDFWDYNILWSLKQYGNVDKPLVVWDIVAALLDFKQSIPKYVEYIVVKWLVVSYLGSNRDVSTELVLEHIAKSLSKVASRQLQLLNVICRCVMLSELKAEEINKKLQNLNGNDAEDKPLRMWMKLLLKCERELRERLVGFSFSFSSNSTSASGTPGYWCPVGLAQMEKWAALHLNDIQDQLKTLLPKRKTSTERIKQTIEEKCCYCSASVPFDSPEVAHCQGLRDNNGVDQKHKLERCAVSMQVCPATPSWFCKCCHRWISELPPESLFTMPQYPLDFKSLTQSLELKEVSKPLCPFCGVLLQRRQLDFLLSPSPV